MHSITTKIETMDLKESGDGHVGKFRGKKRKGEILELQ